MRVKGQDTIIEGTPEDSSPLNSTPRLKKTKSLRESLSLRRNGNTLLKRQAELLLRKEDDDENDVSDPERSVGG